MTGQITSVSAVVTKTSNAVLVMPKHAYIVQKRVTPITLDVKRAMAACCQCRYCTDLCSRNLLGHPIEPHRVMRAVSSGITEDSQAFLSTFSCSACGLCEMYACGQGLNPRTIISETKAALRKNGLMPPKGLVADPVPSGREYRKVPMSRLISRLGLAKYDVPSPVVDTEVRSKKLKVMLSQSIGAPSVACVAVGDKVKAGDVLGAFTPDKLGTAVHAPLDGTVKEVTDKYVTLEV